MGMEGKKRNREIRRKVYEMSIRSRRKDAKVYNKKGCKEKS